jgi:4-hydroxybutyrate CoA-transferase
VPRAQVVKIDEAIGRIGDGARVMITQACGEPRAFVAELLRRAREGRWKRGLTLVAGALLSGYEFLGEPAVSFESWHVMPPMFPHLGSPRVSLIPLRYSEIISTYQPGGRRAIDVLVLTGSRPDDRGTISISASPSYAWAIARRRPKLIIVEVNARLPRAAGTARLHKDDVDVLVEVDYEPVAYAPPPVGPVDRAMAQHLLSVLPDGPTLQVGVAVLPVLDALGDLGARNLRPFGLLVDATARLADKGVLDPTGRMHAGELMGTRRLWDFVARDPRVWLDSAEVTHTPSRIAQEPRFVAVNTALEIDLTGQVNAESLGDSQVSGISGLFDLTLGALGSPGGRAVIALPATAANGARSRIVARLSAGARVTVPRHLADVVITEHGVAELRGRSTAERAKALIAIADPAFREALERIWTEQIRV